MNVEYGTSVCYDAIKAVSKELAKSEFQNGRKNLRLFCIFKTLNIQKI